MFSTTRNSNEFEASNGPKMILILPNTAKKKGGECLLQCKNLMSSYCKSSSFVGHGQIFRSIQCPNSKTGLGIQKQQSSSQHIPLFPVKIPLELVKIQAEILQQKNCQESSLFFLEMPKWLSFRKDYLEQCLNTIWTCKCATTHFSPIYITWKRYLVHIIYL